MRIIGALTASLPGNTHKARITGALRTHIVLQHILGLVFSFPQQFHQFPAVCGDQFLFQLLHLISTVTLLLLVLISPLPRSKW